MATPSNILAWRIPMDRGAWWATVLYSRVRLWSRTRLKQLSMLRHMNNAVIGEGGAWLAETRGHD